MSADHNRWIVDLDATAWASSGAALCWNNWDNDGPPIQLQAEFLHLCPEFTELGSSVRALEHDLAHSIAANGARAGVAAFLSASQDVDDFLDRRAFVVFAAGAARAHSVPALPLPSGLLATRRGQHGRLLRPLEFGAARAVAVYPPRVVLVQLIAAGATVTEAAATATTEVTVSPNRDVSIDVGAGRARRRLNLAPGVTADVEGLVGDSPDGFLLPGGSDPRMSARTHHVSEMARRVLAMVGLATDPTATANSIRLTGLRAIADRYGIEAAAYCAGSQSFGRLQQQLRIQP